MTINSESKAFFNKLSKTWQNFKDYTYLEGITLSPEQISIIEHDSDQLLIEGYAGTGKSLTLLYKLINVLVKQKDKRILYVTFNKTLIDDTKKRLNTSKEYIENKGNHYIRISTFHEIATEVLKENKIIDYGISKLSAEVVDQYRDTAYRRLAAITFKYVESSNEEYKSLKREERLYKTHDVNFIIDEIAWIKAMGFTVKDRYLEIERIGRSKSIRLTRAQRSTIFKIYEEYNKDLKEKYNNYMDLEDYALKIVENEYIIDENKKFDYIFVDEVQDLDPMQIKALCLLTRQSIVLSGDAKQRIYKKSPLKYEDIGLNIREKGKRRILNKNYRSTAEIVKLANDLVFFDNEEKLIEKQFVREGEKPSIYIGDNKSSVKFICNTINKIHQEDENKTIAIIHREDAKVKLNQRKSNLRLNLEMSLLQSFTDIKTYGEKFDYNKRKQIFYTNAYDIKGLEFDYVFIIDFNKEFYPNIKEINKIQTENEGKDRELVNEDIADFINREKKLLYVAMTRARDKMYIIGNGCKSELAISNFIFDFKRENYIAANFTKKSIEAHRGAHNYNMKALLQSKYIKIYEPEKYVEIKSKSIDVDNLNINESKEEMDLKIKDIKVNIIKDESETNLSKETIEVGNLKDISEIINYLKSKGVEVIDKREKGGALWVVGGLELGNDMKILSMNNVTFKFLKKGGKSTKHKPAWYLTR